MHIAVAGGWVGAWWWVWCGVEVALGGGRVWWLWRFGRERELVFTRKKKGKRGILGISGVYQAKKDMP